MDKRDYASSSWSPMETKLFNTVDIFIHKPAIMKKAEANLIELKDQIVNKLSQEPHPCPPESDITKGQIVRGENHKGFPFISLDMPQTFSKTQMFTYRTLFWWGHDLIFSLILKQENLTPLIDKLIKLKDDSEWQNIYLATTPTPWEWENNTNNYTLLAKTSKIKLRKTLETVQHIKLCRFYPLNHPEFSELNWPNAGLANWNILSKVCADL